MVKFIKKYTLPLIIATFILIDLLFNLPLVNEIIKNSQFGSFGGDTILTQYFGESFYRKLISWQNPFSFNHDILYPFGTPTVFAEGGFINALFFIFFRPFLSPHASLLATVILALFLAAIFTYFLLKKLGVSNFFAFLFGLVYAFSPFVSVRIQYHFNYTYHFLFPLTTLLILNILQETKPRKLLINAIFLGLTLPLLVFNTLYYVSFYALFILFLIFYFLLINRVKTLAYLKKYVVKIKYFLLAITLALICLAPFISQSVYAFMIKDHRGQPHGKFPGGTVEFSARPLDLFIPSEFNPVLGKLSKSIAQGSQPIEQIIYPGLLVLVGLFLYIRAKEKRKLFPIFATGLTFYILSLGPYLNIGSVKIPLPYYIVHSLPLLSQMRAPVRYGFIMVFCWVILAALVYSQAFKKYSKNILLAVILIGVFFIDQSYILNVKPEPMNLPLESYRQIKKDSNEGSVMEIPYVIQDGFLYLGKVFYSYPMIGQLIHQKPIVGGYLARVNPYKLNYYMGDPMLSYFGNIVDDRRTQEIEKPALEEMKKSADFLNIRYVLLKKTLKDYREIKKDLEHIGYKLKTENDNGFVFFVKEVNYRPIVALDVGRQDVHRYLFGSWSRPEETHRWIDGDNAGIMFNSLGDNERVLKFEAASYGGARKVSVYVNGKLQQTVDVDVSKSEHSVSSDDVKKGINKVLFIVEDIYSFQKAKTDDPRALSIQFFNIKIQ